jgi:hypothetical protein
LLICPLVVVLPGVLVRVEVGNMPVGVVVGVRQLPALPVKTMVELAGPWVLHRHCVNAPAPSCTPIVAVASVFIWPMIRLKLDVASYSLISK